MGFFDKIFRSKTKEDQAVEEKIEKMQSGGIDVNAPLIENEFICNACGVAIEGKPRFLNHNGRRMVFHKRCLKKLKMGNLSI